MAKSASKITALRRARTAASPKDKAPKQKPAEPAPLPKFPVNETPPPRELRKFPSVWRIAAEGLAILRQRPKLFVYITLIYGVLSLLLVQSLSGTLNIINLQNTLGGSTDRVLNGVVAFEWLLNGSGAAPNTLSGFIEIILILVMSLALVWALRQTMAAGKIRVRDAFYNGMYPIIPVGGVFVVLLVQLIPLFGGLALYNILTAFGFIVSPVSKVLWLLPVAGLALWSLLLVASTIIALYIATLPDMAPMEAVRAAKTLVRGRRWTVLRKIAFLPLALMLIVAAVLIPTLFLAPLLAPWFIFMTWIAGLAFVHAYLYSLYRELIV